MNWILDFYNYKIVAQYLDRFATGMAATLTAAGITPSNSEANRKLKERAVKVDGVVVEDPNATFAPGFEGVLQVGKRNFARVRLLVG